MNTPEEAEILGKKWRDATFEYYKPQIPDYVNKFTELNQAAHDDVENEYKNDVATYKCDVLRFGDFLLLKVQRTAGDKLNKETECLNLGLVKSIRLKNGTPFSHSETANVYYPECIYDNPGRNRQIKMISSFPLEKPYRFLIRSIPSELRPYSSDVFNVNTESKYGMICSDVSVDNVSTYAFSDTISFDGLDYVLSIPYGLGESVRNQILETIRDGYEKCDLSSFTG